MDLEFGPCEEELPEVLVIIGGGRAGLCLCVGLGASLGYNTVLKMQRTWWRKLLGWLNTLGLSPEAGVHNKDIKAKIMIG